MGLNAEFGVGLDHLRLLFHSSVLHVVLGHAIHARHRCVSSGVNLRGVCFKIFPNLLLVSGPCTSGKRYRSIAMGVNFF